MQEEPTPQSEIKPEPEQVSEPTLEPELPEPEAPVPHRKKFSVKRFNQRLTTSISISLKLTGILAALMLLLAIAQELRYDGYSLQEVHVPDEFEKAGLNGSAMAAKIKADIHSIKYRIEHSGFNIWDMTDENTTADNLLESKGSEVEVNLVGVGLSFHSVVNLISNSLGIARTKKIAAYISLSQGKANLSVYIQDQLPVEFYVNVDSLGVFDAADQMAMSTAQSILKISNPELLATYLSYGKRTPETLDKTIDVIKFGLSQKGDTSRFKYLYNLWGWALFDRRNYEEALEKQRRATANDNQFVAAHFILSFIYRELRQFENSRRELIKGMKIAEERRIRQDRLHFFQGIYFFQMTLSYLNDKKYDSASYFQKQANTLIKSKDKNEFAEWSTAIAYDYSSFGFYDSAIVNLQRSLRADSSVVETYSTLAETYGRLKEKDKFYYYLEKAFDKGYRNYSKDYTINPAPPYSYYYKEERYKDILKKYSVIK
ncbi:MAG: hypothetical protein QM734_05970 [Cyclobacteriaceae bacterium]